MTKFVEVYYRSDKERNQTRKSLPAFLLPLLFIITTELNLVG